MKLLYVTDLHGAVWRYKKIFKVAKTLNADIVINGGDLLPMGNLMNQDKFVTNFLDIYFSKLESERIYHISMLCNDDLMIFDEIFDKICDKYKYIISIAQRKFTIGNYEFIGLNWVNDFPFPLKDRARKDTEDFNFPKQFGKPVLSTLDGWKKIDDWYSLADSLPTIEEELNQLIKPKSMKNAVYIIHTPPSYLGLDVCNDGREVGSKAVYKFIEENQPLISLHGHIHESPDISGQWYSKLGRTICIQPGQSSKSQDTLLYVIIDLRTMEIERFQENRFEKT